MPKVTKKNTVLAKLFFAPTILGLLEGFSSEDMALAVKTDLDLVDSLRENGSYLSTLTFLVASIPYSDRVAPYFRSRPWIQWFVENEMKDKRPDLYVQFQYDPSMMDWLMKNLRELTKYLFE